MKHTAYSPRGQDILVNRTKGSCHLIVYYFKTQNMK